MLKDNPTYLANLSHPNSKLNLDTGKITRGVPLHLN